MRNKAINSGAQRRIRAELRVCFAAPFCAGQHLHFLPDIFVILGLDFY
jgi:hypothetical protein